MAGAEAAEKQPKNSRLGDIIADAGILDKKNIEAVVNDNLDSAIRVGSALLKAKLIEEPTLYAALRLQTLLRLGYMQRKDTLEVLKHCVVDKVTLDKALNDKQLFVPSRMQWSWV